MERERPDMDIPRLENYVNKARAAWEQPGLGLSMVEDGGLAYVGGFGDRGLDSGAAVDGDTLFGVASMSKPFTAATLATLVDAGRLGWDDPVVQHLPWLVLYDPWVTAEVRIRDLLSMRLGLSKAEHRHRQVCADRLDHIRRMRFHTPLHPFRAEFAYCSEGFVIASQVVAEVTGTDWADYVRDALWQPLGMTRTNADHRRAAAMDNAASPHMRVDGVLRPVPWYYEDHVSDAAGGVNSTPRDMARWLLFQLSGGEVDGRQLISRHAMAEMLALNTANRGLHADDRFSCVVPEGAEGIRFAGYGLGWYLHDYRGVRVLHHTGAIDGFKGIAGFLPEHGFAAAVLANGPNYHLSIALFQWMVDRVLGLEEVDWSTRFLEHERALERAAEEEERKVRAARRPATSPTVLLDAYAGSFADDGTYGDAVIAREGDGLVLTAGPLTFDLAHWHDDVFEARRRWIYPCERDFFVRFWLDEWDRVQGFDTSNDARFRHTN